MRIASPIAPPMSSVLSRPAPPSAETPFFLRCGRASARRLIRIMPLLPDLPPAEADGDRERRRCLGEPRGVDRAIVREDRPEGVEDLDGKAELVLQDVFEMRGLCATAGDHDRVHAIGARRGLEEIQRLLELGGGVLGDTGEDGLDRLGSLASDLLAPLQGLGLLEVEGVSLLKRVRELVTPERDVAPEDRLPLSEDVHV